MNVTTTLLGLGNAATPFGLKAMKELQSLNDHPEVATDSQIMLLGYNTAGLAILPTTLLGVRQAAHCSDPAEIIGTCIIAGATSTLTAIIMVKLLGRLPVFSRAAAVAEYERDAAAKPASEKEGTA
jgi:spore maturation protein A